MGFGDQGGQPGAGLAVINQCCRQLVAGLDLAEPATMRDAGALRRFQVAGLVSDQGTLGQVDVQIARCPHQHPRIWLAIGMIRDREQALPLGMIGAVINGVDMGPALTKRADHPLHEALKLLLGVIAACDAGLVGCDDHEPAGRVRTSDQTLDVWNEINLVNAMNIAVIDIDDSVTIQKQCWAAHGVNRWQ